jgi:hypothetical protein
MTHPTADLAPVAENIFFLSGCVFATLKVLLLAFLGYI